jgi:hypothetical protein
MKDLRKQSQTRLAGYLARGRLDQGGLPPRRAQPDVVGMETLLR